MAKTLPDNVVVVNMRRVYGQQICSDKCADPLQIPAIFVVAKSRVRCSQLVLSVRYGTNYCRTGQADPPPHENFQERTRTRREKRPRLRCPRHPPPAPKRCAKSRASTDAAGCACRKPCKHIWEKVWRSWIWVNEHEINSADFFLKVDSDTFLFPGAREKTETET